MIVLDELSFLDKLKVLRLKGNKIKNTEGLEKVLMCMTQLETLNVFGNPLTTTKKYRDRIVVAATSLINLDGKKVTQQERDFILALKHKRKGPKQSTKDTQAKVPQLKGISIPTKASYVNQ